MANQHSYQRFNLNEVARSFPDTAETMLLDTYLTNEEAASARVFRVYRETPAHYHVGSDEYLYVLSGSRVLCGRLTVFQAPYCSCPAQDPGGASGVSCRRHAAARPEGHHFRQSCRRHAGKLHPGAGILACGRAALPLGICWTCFVSGQARLKSCPIQSMSVHLRGRSSWK
jgi:hypothetical protein